MNTYITILSVCSLCIHIWGCGAQFEEATIEQILYQEPAASETSPMKLVLLQDKTGSAEKNLTPQLTLEHVRFCIDLIESVGGELIVGFIDEQSDQAMYRLHAGVPPRKPRLLQSSKNPFLARKERAAFRQKKEKYEAEKHRWESALSDRVFAFLGVIEPHLNEPPAAGKSDVLGALYRADYLLNEPASMPDPVRKVVVMVSDAQDNVAARPVPVGLTSGAELILVNGTDSLGDLNALSPGRFESIDSALRYLGNRKA